MTGFQRLAALLVGLLVVAAVAVLVSGMGQDGVGGSPAASAQASPTGSEGGPSAAAEPSADGGPSADPTASQPADSEVLAELAEIEEQVIEIRGLEAADIGPPDIITRAELGEELEALFEEEYPPEERERDNRALRAFGLIGPGDDVAELQLQLLGDQVLGFYDDVDQRMVVVTDAGLDAEAKLTYAHEYTHALQDAAFGLDSLDTDADGEDDRSLARTTLIEGDATVAMLAWALTYLTPEELLEIGTGAQVPDTTGIPSWMVNQLQFPYTAGQLWVGSLAGNPTTPDFTAVDAAYADPPDSTEQVMDADAWASRERPIPVELGDLAAVLGDGWEEVDVTPVGQAAIEITLEHFGITAGVAADAAAGWGGDRSIVVSGPDDAFALQWRLAWDSAADADEFVAAYEDVIADLPFPATVERTSDTEVLVLHASDDAILTAVADAVD